MLHSITANVTGKTRRRFRGGREYLVAPLTLIVPGVLNGSQGPLYYPADEVERDFMAWNEMPIVVYHPQSTDGSHVSAQSPGVLDKQGIGYVRKPAYNGKLTAEGWFDAERTRTVDQRVYDALLRNEPQELSTGLYTDNEPAENGATAPDGRPYTHVARNYRPDHLAILPDQIGACSLRDGCGVLVNEMTQSLNYSPSQPRDAEGKFGSGGGGSSKKGTKLSKKATIQEAARSLEAKGYKLGRGDTDLATKVTSYLVEGHGTKKWMTTDEIRELAANTTVPLEEKLSVLQSLAVMLGVENYNPSQPRDDKGRFGSGGGGGATGGKGASKAHGAAKSGAGAADADKASQAKGFKDAADEDAFETMRTSLEQQIADGMTETEKASYKGDAGGSKKKSKSVELAEGSNVKITSTGFMKGVEGEVVGSTKGSVVKVKVTSMGSLYGETVEVLKSQLKANGQSGQTRNQRRRRSDMTKSREEIVDNLIENSCCWDEADREELMELTDNQLNKLDAALEKQLQADAVVNAAREGFGMDSTITVNAMPEFIKKKMAAAEDEEEEVVDEEKPTGNALTQEQMEDIAFARSIKQERKDAAISVITGNAQNKFTKEQLNAMPLDTLQNLAELAKPIVNESQNVPSYFGAAVPPTANVGTKDDDNDYLPLPTVNWSKQASA